MKSTLNLLTNFIQVSILLLHWSKAWGYLTEIFSWTWMATRSSPPSLKKSHYLQQYCTILKYYTVTFSTLQTQNNVIPEYKIKLKNITFFFRAIKKMSIKNSLHVCVLLWKVLSFSETFGRNFQLFQLF